MLSPSFLLGAFFGGSFLVALGIYLCAPLALVIWRLHNVVVCKHGPDPSDEVIKKLWHSYSDHAHAQMAKDGWDSWHWAMLALCWPLVWSSLTRGIEDLE